MVVIVIIGILATLGYSSLTEIIFTSRAKETAQTIRTFTERALMDAKRQNKIVRICIKDKEIISEEPGTSTGCGGNGSTKIASEALSQGFTKSNGVPVEDGFINEVKSEIRVGLSGVSGKGSFAACGAKGYCGGAAKIETENSFKAYIKKGSNANWEAL